MTAETIPLGCPDCGAKWEPHDGPMQSLDGKRVDCPACGRGYQLNISVTITYTRH